jgi:hypothetical protein
MAGALPDLPPDVVELQDLHRLRAEEWAAALRRLKRSMKRAMDAGAGQSSFPSAAGVDGPMDQASALGQSWPRVGINRCRQCTDCLRGSCMKQRLEVICQGCIQRQRCDLLVCRAPWRAVTPSFNGSITTEGVLTAEDLEARVAALRATGAALRESNARLCNAIAARGLDIDDVPSRDLLTMEQVNANKQDEEEDAIEQAHAQLVVLIRDEGLAEDLDAAEAGPSTGAAPPGLAPGPAADPSAATTGTSGGAPTSAAPPAGTSGQTSSPRATPRPRGQSNSAATTPAASPAGTSGQTSNPQATPRPEGPPPRPRVLPTQGGAQSTPRSRRDAKVLHDRLRRLLVEIQTTSDEVVGLMSGQACNQMRLQRVHRQTAGLQLELAESEERLAIMRVDPTVAVDILNPVPGMVVQARAALDFVASNISRLMAAAVDHLAGAASATGRRPGAPGFVPGASGFGPGAPPFVPGVSGLGPGAPPFVPGAGHQQGQQGQQPSLQQPPLQQPAQQQPAQQLQGGAEAQFLRQELAQLHLADGVQVVESHLSQEGGGLGRTASCIKRLEPESFNGKADEYWQWREDFQAMLKGVYSSAGLYMIQLRQHIKDQRGRSMLLGIQDVNEAWSTLDAHYGDKNAAIAFITSRLRQTVLVGPPHERVIDLAQAVQQAVTSLRQVKAENVLSTDYSIIGSLVSKLGPVHQSQYDEHVSLRGGKVCWSSFHEWLMLTQDTAKVTRVRELGQQLANGTDQKKQDQRKGGGQGLGAFSITTQRGASQWWTREETTRAHLAHLEGRLTSCPICAEAGSRRVTHRFAKDFASWETPGSLQWPTRHVRACPTFMGMTADERGRAFVRHKMCLRCGDSVHQQEGCRRQRPCCQAIIDNPVRLEELCEEPHLTALHGCTSIDIRAISLFEQVEDGAPRIVGGAVDGNLPMCNFLGNPPLLAVVSVATSKGGENINVMCDEGAQVSLIRHEVGERLSVAPPRAWTLNLQVVGQQYRPVKTKLYTVSLIDAKGIHHTITAAGIDSISSAGARPTPDDLDWVRKIFPAVKPGTLSRPQGQVDVLLGVCNIGLLPFGGKIKGNLRLERSVWGEVLRGSCSRLKSRAGAHLLPGALACSRAAAEAPEEAEEFTGGPGQAEPGEGLSSGVARVAAQDLAAGPINPANTVQYKALPFTRPIIEAEEPEEKYSPGQGELGERGPGGAHPQPETLVLEELALVRAELRGLQSRYLVLEARLDSTPAASPRSRRRARVRSRSPCPAPPRAHLRPAQPASYGTPAPRGPGIAGFQGGKIQQLDPKEEERAGAAPLQPHDLPEAGLARGRAPQHGAALWVRELQDGELGEESEAGDEDYVQPANSSDSGSDTDGFTEVESSIPPEEVSALRAEAEEFTAGIEEAEEACVPGPLVPRPTPARPWAEGAGTAGQAGIVTVAPDPASTTAGPLIAALIGFCPVQGGEYPGGELIWGGRSAAGPDTGGQVAGRHRSKGRRDRRGEKP